MLKLSSQEKAWLIEHPTLRLGVDPNYPPWEFLDDEGRHVGIMADYMRFLEARLDIHLEKVVAPSFDVLAQMAKEKSIDILPGLEATPERSMFLKFSRPYLEMAEEIAFTRVNFPMIGTMKGLAGRKVAFVRAYSGSERWIDGIPAIEPLMFDSVAEALSATATGTTEATVTGFDAAAYEMHRLNITNLKIAAKSDSHTGTFHIGVRDDWPVLVGILDKALESITTEEHQKIREPWTDIHLTVELSNFINELRKTKTEKEELSSQNLKLQGQNLELEAYAHTIAHSLKTPLAASLRFLEILAKYKSDNLSVEQRQLLTQALSTLERTGQVVDDLLLLSSAASEGC